MPAHTPLFSAQSGFDEINRQFEKRSVEDLLCWTLWTFGDKVAQVTSFGPAGMVILDHLARLSPGVRVITIDTSFLFPETYELWQEIQRRYPIQLEIRRSALSPLAQAQQYGQRLWERDPDKCCEIRKVTPLNEAMQGLDAWITGLRRDQSPTRTAIPLLGWDNRYQLVKVNPLALWTRNEVWRYIHQRDIPYNPLHDRGYTSIGCAQCTRPAVNSDDERSGRWYGQSKIECGIHYTL